MEVSNRNNEDNRIIIQKSANPNFYTEDDIILPGLKKSAGICCKIIDCKFTHEKLDKFYAVRIEEYLP